MTSLMFLIMTSFSMFMWLSNNEMKAEIREIESLKEKMMKIDDYLMKEKEQLQTIVDFLIRKENTKEKNPEFLDHPQYIDQIVELIVTNLTQTFNISNNNNHYHNKENNDEELVAHLISNNNTEKKGKHFLSVLVPSSGELGRNLRPIFCTYMTSFLNQQLGENNYEILFAEQMDSLPFNKAYSYNIAAIFANPAADYFAIHDVDLLPFTGANYSFHDEVVRLTKFLCNYEKFRTCQQNRWPIDLLGGAFLITKRDFELVNGMSNSFWGWGGEGYYYCYYYYCYYYYYYYFIIIINIIIIIIIVIILLLLLLLLLFILFHIIIDYYLIKLKY